jgi:transcriptional regulator with XRE-family HTH domain
MSVRLDRISRIIKSQKSRASYIKAKLVVLVPAQIRALRLRSSNPPMPFQRDLAREAGMHQSRISMFETPGTANITLETLAKIAAGLRVGVIVKFVSFHEMLRWENSFSPDTFHVTPRLEEDNEFLNPPAVPVQEHLAIGFFQDGGNVGGGLESELEVACAQSERKPMGREMAIAAGTGVGGA